MRTADVAARLRLGRRCQKCNKRTKSSPACVLARSDGRLSRQRTTNRTHTHAHSLQHPRCCSRRRKKEGTRVTRDESGPRARPPAEEETAAQATPQPQRCSLLPKRTATRGHVVFSFRLAHPSADARKKCRGERTKPGFVSTIGAGGHRGPGPFFNARNR